MEIKDNVIQLQEVHKKLNLTVGETIALLEKGSLAVDKYNKSLTNVPSQYISQMKNVKTSVDNVTVSTDKLAQSEKQIIQVKQTLAKKTSEEIVNGAKLRQNADLQAKANSNLLGSYARLSASVTIASNKYQDLIVRGRLATQTQKEFDRELKVAGNEFRVLQTKVLQADRAVDKWNRTGQRSIGGLKNLAGAFGIIGGVTMFAMATRDAFNLVKELQSLNIALELVSGNSTVFAENQQFLADTSEAFGLEINGLTKQFTQFYVSAKDKLAGQEIQQIFKSVSKASASMGLSQQQSERAFLALNQMMSKGTIQAEELRGQLGEALPGALGIMAKAVGVNEKQLGEMMKKGELLASDVLPRFAEQLEKTYGIETLNRIETVTSAQNRLSNAWTSFIASLDSGNGVISRTFIFLTTKLTQLLGFFEKINNISWTQGQVDEKKRLSTLERNKQEELEILKGSNEKQRALRKAMFEADLIEFENDKKLYNEREKLYRSNIEDIGQSTNRKAEFQDNKKKLEGLSDLRASNQKMIEITKARMSVVDDFKELEIKEIEVTKTLTKAKEKQNEIYKIGTEKWIREQISELRSLQETNDTTTESYKLSTKTIEFYEQWLERLKGTTKETKDEIESLGIALDLSDDLAQTEGAFEDFKKVADEYAKTFKDDFIGNAGLTTFFDILEGNIQGFGSNWKTTTLAIMEATQEMFNFIETLSNNSFELEKSMLDDQYSYRMELANGNAEAEKRLSEEKERREKEILNREAKAKKKLAIFNIAIDTAQAIIASFKTDPTGITAAIIGAIGLAQGIVVASQEVPQYWRGTENAKEGWAYTQEKGAEIITDSKGNIKDMGSNDGAKLTYMKRGDKVKTAYQTKDLINKMAMDSLSLSLPQQKQQNTFTKEDLSKEFSKLAKEFRNRKGANVNVVNKIENSRVNLKSQIV